MRQAVAVVRRDFATEGKPINEQAVDAFKRKADACVRRPLAFWAILYLFLFIYLPSKEFALSLLGLVVPILGYFGFMIGPSIEADDIMDLSS